MEIWLQRTKGTKIQRDLGLKIQISIVLQIYSKGYIIYLT